MKMKRGFTLPELLIGVAIFLLIIGVIVGVFSTGLRSLVTGHDQAGAYAEARDVMNDLKTTLRYADKASIKLTDGKLEYRGEAVLGPNTNASTTPYSRVIEWKPGSDKKQLLITKENNVTVEFPKNLKNSAFTETEYNNAYHSILGADAALSTPFFPIFEKSSEPGIYNIVLPIKYPFLSGNKVEILRTKVNVKEDAEQPQTPAAPNETLSKAIIEYLRENPTGLGNGNPNNIISQIDSGSAPGGMGLAGATKNLVEYMKKHYPDAYTSSKLDTLSWSIVSINGGGTPTTSISSIKAYKIYVAQNVVDDVYNSNENGTQKKLAEEQGVLVIRVNWGFMTNLTVFDTDGGIKEAEKHGFTKGVKNSKGTRIINTSAWTEDYTKLGVGKNRIDYTSAGKEYTRATEGASYSYPPPVQ